MTKDDAFPHFQCSGSLWNFPNSHFGICGLLTYDGFILLYEPTCLDTSGNSQFRQSASNKFLVNNSKAGYTVDLVNIISF